MNCDAGGEPKLSSLFVAAPAAHTYRHPPFAARATLPDSSPRALFAARLIQARQLRGLSQRALGDRMGLGKDKGSSRINRYEHQVTAIGFDSLGLLAQLLDVPVAYLLADDAAMADAHPCLVIPLAIGQLLPCTRSFSSGAPVRAATATCLLLALVTQVD